MFNNKFGETLIYYKEYERECKLKSREPLGFFDYLLYCLYS